LRRDLTEAERDPTKLYGQTSGHDFTSTVRFEVLFAILSEKIIRLAMPNLNR
jgi:hypothetical protein